MSNEDAAFDSAVDLRFKDVPEGMSCMATMDHRGDTKQIWDPTRPEEVEAARVTFNTLTKDKKYLAFHVNKKGDTGEQMKEFDPNAGRIIFVPPMAGG